MTDQAYQRLLAFLVETHDVYGTPQMLISVDTVREFVDLDPPWFQDFQKRLKEDSQPYACQIHGARTVGYEDPSDEFLFERISL